MANRPNHLPKVITNQEAICLLEAIKVDTGMGIRNRAMLECMRYAGMRKGEVEALKPDHIRWDDYIIEIHDGKGAKDRNIPIDGKLRGWLARWAELRPMSNWFFCTQAGEKVYPTYLQNLVKRLAKKIGLLKPVSPHTLRHTYATELLKKGFNIEELRQLLGHSDISTTSVYLHICPDDLGKKVRNKLR